ncbi:sugar ABC transporter permease [Muricomes sp. OA1]|uniref:Sugar ABC transporter permease n=2 Tax=Lachnospiraceae TaxID=186803 RepID=A0A3E2X3K1_9FIRM|nr:MULTISPECIES: sugar ABC transporter permease [Clostridia]MEE0203664.1 sugar ABC transporter permease [Muricomes sp.]MCH1971752.1 sugar ABC transporter permease [Muricomes sp. OA1]MRM87734.1 sugar ABC transporter permease [Faecalicatena contorta]RGC35469.1 sugar ABC transporter permease [Hungatella hathewayi]GKH35026.1 sugar ABC transporter permease [Faecalicatena contorta]
MNKKVKSKLINFSFLLPVLFFFGFSVIIPFFSGLHIALTDWNGVSKELNYVGFKNFINIFSNKDILQPVQNTICYTLIATIAGNIISLLLALAINRKFIGRTFARTAFFLPTAISVVLAVFIWGYIFRDVFRNLFGLNSLLGQKSTVILGIAIIHMWIDVGINMLVYLSSLTTVPKELYESADLDGATRIQQFFRVTLPMIVPAFTTCITLSLTYGLREFATPYAATQGGPAGASETIGIYIYNHLMSYNKAGYGQAISVVFTIALVLIGGGLSRALRRLEVEA